MLDPKALWKDFHWTQTRYKKSSAWPMKRPCWTQKVLWKNFYWLKRAIKSLLDPWKDHAGPKSVMKRLFWTQTCFEKTFAWPMKRPCWTQRCNETTFIELKRAIKRVLLDPWKDHAGPKGVMKRLLLDSNVPWRDFCLTHEKTMLDTKVLWKHFYWTQTCYKKSFCLTHEKTMLDPKVLWKDFYWTQTCCVKTFAWPMKRPC